MELTLKAENLCKSYNGIPVVENLNIEVRRGEVYGLLGPNGAGKSTSIECMLGTRRADRGTVTVLGMNPVTDRKKLFERVGVQFQEANYQDRITVEELCTEIQSLYQKAGNYEELLQQFHLTDKKKSPVSELSGGQKQRLFFILALIPDPEIVFFDELTTGLDAKARREVWKYLEELKRKGLTIFLTSHFMDEVELLCDRITILKKGRTVYWGTVKEAVAASPYDKFEDAYLWYTGEEEIIDEAI